MEDCLERKTDGGWEDKCEYELNGYRAGNEVVNGAAIGACIIARAGAGIGTGIGASSVDGNRAGSFRGSLEWT